MTLDSASAHLVEQMAQSGAPPLWQLSPTDARALGASLVSLYGSGPRMAKTHDEVIDSDAGGQFKVRILTPSDSTPRAAIVYFHGGGWVTGNIDEFEAFGRTFARATDALVVLVDYRKAPEHQFPIPVEDAWSALKWVADHLESIAGERVPLIVAGDSSGGNLAAVVAVRARDRGGPRLDAQVLAYPVTDSDFGTSSYVDPKNQLLLDRQGMVWYWNHYLPEAGVRTNAEASPLRAESLADLPPAVVLTAEHDVLRDEGEAYVKRLTESGVKLLHKRFPGQMHAFFTFVNILPGSDDGIRYVAESIDTLFRED